jgi:hypothetical protein
MADFLYVFPKEPTKPMNAAKIAKLGAAWDDLDREVRDVWAASICPERTSWMPDSVTSAEWHDLGMRYMRAEIAYQVAVANRDEAELIKLQQRKRVPNKADYDRLLSRWAHADRLRDGLKAMADLYTDRECFDIRNAAQQAKDLREIAQTKFDLDRKRQRDDKRAGIVRVHRRSQEVHL